VGAIERMNPIRKQETSGSRAIGVIAIVAIVMVIAGILLASTAPDGIQKLLSENPAADETWMRRAITGLGGLVLIYGICAIAGRMLRPRSA